MTREEKEELFETAREEFHAFERLDGKSGKEILNTLFSVNDKLGLLTSLLIDESDVHIDPEIVTHARLCIEETRRTMEAKTFHDLCTLVCRK